MPLYNQHMKLRWQLFEMKTIKTSILLVLPWSTDEPGGVSVVVRHLLKNWGQDGLATKLLISDWYTPRHATDAVGIAKLRLAVASTESLPAFLRSLLSAPRTLFRTWRFLQHHAISSVGFHYVSLDALGIALLRRLGLYRGRLVLCFHGTDVRRPASRLERWLWNSVFDSADVITACSHALAQALHQQYQLPITRISVVYNGVDATMFAPGASAVMSLPFATFVVTIGSYIPLKGHRFLLDAFALIAARYPAMGLVIIGKDGAERQSMQAQVDAFGLTARVCFMVNLEQEQVASIVARASACIQPSLAESFGLAVIEAGACGVCVGVSAIGGHLELIKDKQNGLVFPAADADAIADVLIRMLDNPAATRQMAQQFRASILERYTWQRCSASYLALSEAPS